MALKALYPSERVTHVKVGDEWFGVFRGSFKTGGTAFETTSADGESTWQSTADEWFSFSDSTDQTFVAGPLAAVQAVRFANGLTDD